MRTQKAKGIIKGLPQFLNKLSPPGEILRDDGKHKPYHLIGSNKSIDNFILSSEDRGDCCFPKFARPCPLKPAHGFVDSGPVNSKKELEDLYLAIKKVDPKGEIILAPIYNNIKSSFIFVDDGLLSIGSGNDGATSGKNSISFPVCPDKVTKVIKKLSGINIKDSVYMEGLYASLSGEEFSSRLVQLRGGPEMVIGSKDYIPVKTKVTNVVIPHDNLIAWANDVASFKDGTVVYGKGHTMASHAAVHCILNKIPFVTSFEPKVDSVISPTEDGKSQKISRSEFRKGAHVALHSNLWEMGAKQILYFSFSVLHNWAYLRKSDHASWLLGAASASLSSLCTALVLGEYRHAQSTRKPQREVIYQRALGNKSLKQFPKLPEAFKSFSYGNNWSSGFGGMKWGICTHYTVKLYRSLTNIYNGKNKSDSVSDKQAGNLLENFNRLVNLVHNGGWWFNKIAVKEDMNFCSTHPGLAAASVANIYLELYNSVNLVKKVGKEMPVLPALQTSLLETDNGVRWVQLFRKTISANSNTVEIQILHEQENLKGSRQKISLTDKELQKVKEGRNNRYYLKSKKDKGFYLPGGRVVISLPELSKTKDTFTKGNT